MGLLAYTNSFFVVFLLLLTLIFSCGNFIALQLQSPHFQGNNVNVLLRHTGLLYNTQGSADNRGAADNNQSGSHPLPSVQPGSEVGRVGVLGAETAQSSTRHNRHCGVHCGISGGPCCLPTQRRSHLLHTTSSSLRLLQRHQGTVTFYKNQLR